MRRYVTLAVLTLVTVVSQLVAATSQPATQPTTSAVRKAQDLGIPVNAVNYENSAGVLAAGPKGEGTMFYTSYYRSTGAELVGYDFRKNVLVRKNLASGGGYGLTVGADGAVYVGGVGPGDMYRYDPRTDALSTIQCKQFGVDYIWDLSTGPDGVIYAGAGYPRTKLVAFDPKSGQPRDYGEMVPGEQYLRSACVDRLGKVWCGVGMKAHLVVYDPAKDTKQEVLPDQYAASSSVYDITAVGDYVVASVSFDGVVLVYDVATQKVLRTIPRPAKQKSWMISAVNTAGHTAYLWTLPACDAYRCDLRTGELTLLVERLGQVKFVEADRWLHAVDDQSYLAYDIQEKRVVARQMLTAGGDGMDVFSLMTGPDGNIYGSTYINMHIFQCDAASGKLTDLGKVTQWAGQVDSMSLGADGLIYMGAYTDAVVSIYDPKKPWNPGLAADTNPREIGPVGKGQYRTRTNCLGPDGKIYVGSIPAYRSAETGAFTICDPKTGAMDVKLDFVKGGAVDVLVSDKRYVYGAGGGEFFVYDPTQQKKIFQDSRGVVSLVLAGDGQVVGSGANKLFYYDRTANKIVSDKLNPLGNFSHMAAGPGGIYGINAKTLARIVPSEATAEVYLGEGGKYLAVDGRGAVYFARGPRLFRCLP